MPPDFGSRTYLAARKITTPRFDTAAIGEAAVSGHRAFCFAIALERHEPWAVLGQPGFEMAA